MADDPSELGLIVYAPTALKGESLGLTIVHGMEGALPGLRLAWTTSDSGDLVALPHRDEWVTAQAVNGRLPLLCNNDDHGLVTVAGWENPNGLAAGSPPHFEVHADLPLDAEGIAAALDVLEAVAEGTRAFWGHVTPFTAGVEIAKQTSPTLEGPPRPPRGLPVLKTPAQMPSLETPHRLGWLNYWSAAAARAIGFPDAVRDADLLSNSRRTATGGWLVRLTEDPLDLDDAAHLDALQHAYARFPAIGGRAL